MKGRKEKDSTKAEAGPRGRVAEDKPAPAKGSGVETLDIMVPPERLAELMTAAQEAEKYRDIALRARADYDNLRKRVERDAEESRDKRLKDLFEAVLPVLESFILAFERGEAWSDDSLVEGLRMTFNQLMEVFGKFGLERIETVGRKFDPAVHEVVDTESGEGREPNEIVRELSPGFTFKGRTLKPSRVVVAVAGEKKE